MKVLRNFFCHFLFILLVIILCLSLDINYALAIENIKIINRPSRITWLERPWEVRYVLFVMSKSIWNWSKQKATENNHNPNNKYKDFLEWEEFFDATEIVAGTYKTPYNWVVVSIMFDREGWVISPHTHQGPLRGRISEQLNFTLSDGDGLEDKAYDLGYWFMGINEYVPMGVTPGVCQFEEMQPLLGGNRNSTSYRYGNNYTSFGISLFGCREWGYQLRAPFRPYIDVSSYAKSELDFNDITKKKNKKILKTINKLKNESTRHSKLFEATLINFIGWGDFEHRKPVIGQNLGDWFCFFECPNGEAPGPIDIESWTKRNGWRVPIPPTRMPVFPDDPNLQGDYPDAYNPLSD